MVELSTLDWAVLAGFFVLLLGVVVMSMRQKEEDTADYFLAGRNASWLVIGASIFASNIGSEHLVGLSGSGFSNRICRCKIMIYRYCFINSSLFTKVFCT